MNWRLNSLKNTNKKNYDKGYKRAFGKPKLLKKKTKPLKADPYNIK